MTSKPALEIKTPPEAHINAAKLALKSARDATTPVKIRAWNMAEVIYRADCYCSSQQNVDDKDAQRAAFFKALGITETEAIILSQQRHREYALQTLRQIVQSEDKDALNVCAELVYAMARSGVKLTTVAGEVGIHGDELIRKMYVAAEQARWNECNDLSIDIRRLRSECMMDMARTLTSLTITCP